MSARVLIVGCGAIGGLFASALSSVADVIAYDANAEHVRAINEQGLRITGKSPRVARITATDDAATLKGQSFDAIFFLTKSKATGEALRQLQPLIAGTPLLVTLQNGMGNAEVLLSAPGTVVRGVTMNAGRYIEPGAIENLIEGKTWLGPVRGSVEDIKPLGDLLNAAGYRAEVLADPMGAVWSKFVFNCVMNPVGALMLGDNAARYDAPEVRALIDDMAAESMAVVRALGAPSPSRRWNSWKRCVPAKSRGPSTPAPWHWTSSAGRRLRSTNSPASSCGRANGQGYRYQIAARFTGW